MPRPGPIRIAGIIAVLGAAVGAAAAQVTVEIAGGQARQVEPPAALDPVVDEILTSLEAREVDDLAAALQWDIESVIEEDRITKRGEVWFKQMEPVAKFRAKFDRKIVGDRADKISEEHIFDGQWYFLIQHDARSVTKEQIRKPGDKNDPYRLGYGAFPLPFGQKKADILREFTVERVAPQPGDPPDTDHLKLTPRPGMQMAPHYRSIHFWVLRTGEHKGLPVKAMVQKLGGTGQVKNIITATFRDIRLNSGLGTSVFNFRVPLGYQVEENAIEPAP